MEEDWKDVKGYEGLYQVSNKGRIRTPPRDVTRYRKGKKDIFKRKERILKPCPNRSGYVCLYLYKNGKRTTRPVHQLMAEAFLGHKPNGHKIVVDHIDNNRLNNNLENLQLITQRENISKDRCKGTSKYTGVSWSKSSNKWVSSMYVNGKTKHLGTFTDEHEAHKAYQKEIEKL